MLTLVIEIKNVLTKVFINLKCLVFFHPLSLRKKKNVLTTHLSAVQTEKYIAARQTDRRMDEPSCRHLFSLCHRQRTEDGEGEGGHGRITGG